MKLHHPFDGDEHKLSRKQQLRLHWALLAIIAVSLVTEGNWSHADWGFVVLAMVVELG